MRKIWIAILILAVLPLSVLSNNTAEANDKKIELMCRKWRGLSRGISPKQAEKIIGKAKLSFRTSDYCYSFYQLPFKREDGNKINNGILIFKARSLSNLIFEKENECAKKIAQIEEKKEKQRYKETKYKYRDRVQRRVDNGQSRPIPYEKTVTELDLKAMERWDAIIAKERQKYDKQIANLKNRPRSPVYALEMIIEPNWQDKATVLSKNKYNVNFKSKCENPLFWQKLKFNQTPKQVIAILGNPTNKKVSLHQSVYLYSEDKYNGFVIFKEGEKGVERVSSWVEPLWIECFFDLLPEPPAVPMPKKDGLESGKDEKIFYPYQIPCPMV